MLTDIQICNLALQKIGHPSILALTENSKAARECAKAYAPMRDKLLRSYEWNFARARVALPSNGDVTVPFGFTLAYRLPADYLRVIDVVDADADDYAIEGKHILTDLAAPLKLIYVRRAAEGDFDAQFVNCLAYEVAIAVCEAMTQSATKKQALQDEYYRLEKPDALDVDASEAANERPRDTSFITVRR